MKCTSCKSREAEPDKKSCQHCIDAAMERTKIKREKLKAQGICIRCEKNPSVFGRTCCQECLDRDNERAMQSYRKRQSQNICVNCGKAQIVHGAFCQTCYEGDQKWRLEYEAKLKSLGLCIKCAKEPIAATSSHMCASCLGKQSQRAETKRTHRRAVNQCHVCGSPAPTGYTLCDRCRAARNQREQDGYFNGLRTPVLERDHYSCRLCGHSLAAEDCRVHHIDITGKTDSPNNDIINLVTLCNPCHLRIHTILRKTKDLDLLMRLIQGISL